MSIRSALGDFFSRFNGRSPKSKHEEIKQLNAANETAEDVVNEIRKQVRNSSDLNKAAKDYLVAAIDLAYGEDGTPQMDNAEEIASELSRAIAQSPVVSDEVLPASFEASIGEPPDELKVQLIEEGKLKPRAGMKLIDSFQDESIKEENLHVLLKDVLELCRTSPHDMQIVRRLKEIKTELEKRDFDVDIHEIIEKVVARRVAENYWNPDKRTTVVSFLSPIMSPARMLDRKIPEKAEEEFQEILSQNRKLPDGKTHGTYDIDDFRMNIINQIGRDVGADYSRTRVFMLPQTTALRNLNPEEEEVLFRGISGGISNIELTDEMRLSVKEQAKGIIKDDKLRSIIIMDSLNNLPNAEFYKDMITEILSDEQKTRALITMERNGLLEYFGDMSRQNREKSIQAIGDTIKAKMAERTKREKPTQETVTAQISDNQAQADEPKANKTDEEGR